MFQRPAVTQCDDKKSKGVHNHNEVSYLSIMMSRLLIIAMLFTACTGFAPTYSVRCQAISSPLSTLSSPLPIVAGSRAAFASKPHPRGTPLQATSSQLLIDTLNLAVHENAGIDGMMLTSSSIILSETEAWVQPLSLVLGPFLTFFSFAMVRHSYLY